MPKLPHFHLHRIRIDGKPLPIVVNARSQAAVRDHFIERHIQIERLTPEEAFKAGVEGAIIESVSLTCDAGQPAPADTAAEPGLFDQATSASETPPAVEAGAASRPIDTVGPGYVAAVSAAATL